MPTGSGEAETLARLGDDEADLEREIARARAEATERVEAARREAALIAAESQRAAEREGDRLRAAAAEAVDRLVTGAEAELQARAAELRRRAERGREGAVRRILEVVLGRAP